MPKLTDGHHYIFHEKELTALLRGLMAEANFCQYLEGEVHIEFAKDSTGVTMLVNTENENLTLHEHAAEVL